MDSVYPPKEDSYLLAKEVAKHAFGRVLDIGTGSGIQAKTAAESKNVKNVTAVDINPEAIIFARKNNFHKKISYKQSDLFSSVKKAVFETIIFNPPYLPDDARIKDVALDGGKKGYELTVRFLKEANDHLETKGIILLLFSSLTNKKIVDQTLKEQLYEYEQLSEEKYEDSEILYVYKIKKSDLLKKLEEKKVNSVELFAKGKRGVVYKASIGKKLVAIKMKNEKSTVDTISYEADILKQTNKLGIGPKLIANGENYFIMDFIEGKRIDEFIKNADKKTTISSLLKVIKQLRILDEHNIEKQEMSHPYKHVLITAKQQVVLIDFERVRKRPTPSNITQFLDYLTSNYLAFELQKKEINLDKQKIQELSKDYKNNQTKQNLKRIADYIRGV